MLFGQLHQGSQFFYRHLQSKDGEMSLFHVFSHLAVEYRDDALTSKAFKFDALYPRP